MPYSLHPAPSRRRLITPDGFPTTNPNAAIPADPDERMVFARRLVADRCLYGVDKNPLAVEMAKLSLWLITLAKGQPFSFLDHALRSGDSLLGVGNVRQILNWDLAASDDDRGAYRGFLTQPLERALERAGALRRRIQSTPVRDARDAEQKQRWLHEAEDAMGLVRLAADLLIAAQLHKDRKRRAELSEEFQVRLSVAATAWEDARRDPTLRPTGNRAELAALRREADELLAGRTPFHWPLEFPEVFGGSGFRPSGSEDTQFDTLLESARTGTRNPIPDTLAEGFAAIVGNPPFLGGKRISTLLGEFYERFLKTVITQTKGSADLCTYFFLRAGAFVRRDGQIGLLATNTIAQGDTREVGLHQMIQEGFTISRAVSSRPWPGVAGVEVAQLWLRYGSWQGLYILNEQEVDGITAYLSLPGIAKDDPQRLALNSNRSFVGSYILGKGFVLEPNEAEALIAKNQRNHDVLIPYLNGEDLNSRPDLSPSRWVINFHDWPLEQAKMYPDCLDILIERVKPQRDEIVARGKQIHEYAFWKFWDKRPELYATISKLDWVLVTARVSKLVMFAVVNSNIVFSEQVVVITRTEKRNIAILQSSLHVEWAWQYSSTMRDAGIRYSPTDCFETFPFPWKEHDNTQYPIPDTLDTIGERYHTHRQNVMRERNEGLTKTYNRFHNPNEASADIAELRRLHVEMDNAVAAAYGWADLDLGHGFHDTKQGLRYTISEAARRTVLDRLLALNHERYAEEVAAGLHEKKKGIGDRVSGMGKKGRKGKKRAEPETRSVEPEMEQGELF